MRSPKLFLLGAIPALITTVLFIASLVALLLNIDTLVAWMSPFAEGWDETWRAALRVALGVAVVAASVMLMVVAFSTITLAIGSPFYDLIAQDVERRLGDAPPEAEEPLPAMVWRVVRQALGMIAVSLLVTIVLFFCGFIPLVGQTVVPVVAALIGGWLIAIELVGSAFDRRGLMRIKQRRAHLGRHRLRTLGFAVPAYLLLAIPLLSIVVFPAATAGATVLARQVLGEPDGRPRKAEPLP
ncbi:EI24 domain-containing protein [Allonocardiopsis opalescens]|uniref:CysZ protein n=1 Tax=Allonocardiopsis opalescens TaxID=1144618 RepID=A0A2T0PVV2_9ACTN|nr:CysZ protein [Allonocardiopsis opalescens]